MILERKFLKSRFYQKLIYFGQKKAIQSKIDFTSLRLAKWHIYGKEVEKMGIDELTLDEIFARVKAECIEECRAKAETEYLLQKGKDEITNDEER